MAYSCDFLELRKTALQEELQAVATYMAFTVTYMSFQL